MYSKDQTKQIKQEFWTAFGTVMKPCLSASGFRINWINYKTQIKNINFKMNADNKKVFLGICIQHKDSGIRELYFEQFLEFKTLFSAVMEEEWNWEEESIDEYGRAIALISISSNGNIFDKNEWQQMFAFLKHRMLKLDEFWEDAKEIFKSL